MKNVADRQKQEPTTCSPRIARRDRGRNASDSSIRQQVVTSSWQSLGFYRPSVKLGHALTLSAA